MKWLLVIAGMAAVVGGCLWFFWGKAEKLLQPYVISFNVGKELESGRVEELEKLIATASGKWAVYVHELDSGKTWGINENEIMPAASIMKLPALSAAFGKREETWVLEKADVTPGSGPLQFVKPGTAVKVERVITELGKKSDNTAWVMINRRLGYAAMDETVDEWGLESTSYRDLTTTAFDVGKMWQYIYEKPELWEYLEESIYEDRITLGIPAETKLVHKVGTDTDVWSDSGIVVTEKPFIVVVMNKGVEREEAQKIVPEVTKIIWDYETTN